MRKNIVRIAAGLTLGVTLLSPMLVAGAQMSSTTLGARIDDVNSTFTDFLTILIQKYWPFLLGATLLVIVWAFGKKILHYFT